MKINLLLFHSVRNRTFNLCLFSGKFPQFFKNTLCFALLFAAGNLFSQNPFIATWKTDNPGTSNSTSITIPTFGAGYNYEVDWNNDGTYDQTGLTASIVHDFGVAGTYTIRIRGTFPRIYFNNATDPQKLIGISQWGAFAWASMEGAFYGCSNLNITASDVPNLSGVTSMFQMFRGCTTLNGPANIGTWNTAAVTNMKAVFYQATAFNQPIGAWNTAAVTVMHKMFWQDIAFNQPIDTWNTAAVTDMKGMFYGATAFNQSLGTWNTAAVTTMSQMFTGASAFNQSIGTWALHAAVDLTTMLDNCGMECKNYSATLIAWNNNPATPNMRSLGAIGRKYETNAVSARTNLTTAKGWAITGDALVPTVYYADVDGDGFGAGTGLNACAQPIGYVTNNTDCDDSNAAIKPGATETCNTIDDDCDGLIDDSAPCAVPTSLAASNITASAATLAWVNCGATVYQLQYRRLGTSTFITIKVTAPTTKLDLSGLAHNTTYQYRVRAKCAGVYTAYSPLANFTTIAGCSSTYYTSSSVTNNSFTVNWFAVPGNAGQQIQYKLTSATVYTTVNVPAGNSTYTTPTNLLPSTAYDYRVRVKCGTTFLPFLPLTTITTAAMAGSEDRTNMDTQDVTMTLSPNPATELVTMQLQTPEPLTALFLTNSLGKVQRVFDTEGFVDLKQELNLHGLAPGVYRLVAQTKCTNQVGALVKM